MRTQLNKSCSFLVTPQRVGMMVIITACVIGSNASARDCFEDAIGMIEIKRWDLAFSILLDCLEQSVGMDGAVKLLESIVNTHPLDNSGLELLEDIGLKGAR